MTDAKPTITIAQLYPDLLGTTGDRGNVEVLESRLSAAGIPTRRELVHVGEEIGADVDIIVIGNGPLSAMRQVRADLAAKSEAIRAHVAAGGVLLAVGAGAELLSTEVRTLDAEKLEGIGVFPFHVLRTRERRVGYVIAETAHGELIGFEDHASTWVVGADTVPYGRVTAGRGSIGALGPGAGESIRVGQAYATNVQGPVLPLNPGLADALLEAASARRGIRYATSPSVTATDALAEGARADIRRLVNAKTFSAMGI